MTTRQAQQAQQKSKTKKKVPELRFGGFSGEWEEKKLGEVFERVTRKNKENNKNVLTISAQQGLVNQKEYFLKAIASKDVTGYYLLHKGDFAYNKSYSKGYPMGAIKRLKNYNKGVVSTLYICFALRDSGYSEYFFDKYFNAGKINRGIAKIAQEGARNHGLLNMAVNDFFDDIEITIPEKEEQEKIAGFLSVVDEWVENLKGQKEDLEKYKKAVMQKLFPTKGEQVPQLRFSGFTGNWEEKKLGEVSKITTGKLDANAMTENGKYRFYTCAKDFYNINKYAFNTEALLISGNGANVGYIHYYKGKFNAYQRTYVLNDFNQDIIFTKYFLQTTLKNRIEREKKAGNTPYIVIGNRPKNHPSRTMEKRFNAEVVCLI